jgi:hypothetical protein
MTTDIYGPNTTSVAAFLERLRTLTPAQGGPTQRRRGRRTGRMGRRMTPQSRSVVRDRISPEHFATLVQPFTDAGLGEWIEETPA